MKTEKSCDNCIYSIPDWTNVCNPDHYCSNQKSEEYGYNAEYLNGCDEWKSIEPNLGNNGSICTKTGVNEEDRTTDDLISRQAAIDMIDAIFPVDSMKTEYTQGIACGAALAKTYIKQLPSAQSETHDKRMRAI